MTVAELIEKLSEFPGNLPVLTAKDEEGNGYRHVYGADDDAYCSSMEIEEHEPEFVYYLSDIESDNEMENYMQLVVIY